VYFYLRPKKGQKLPLSLWWLDLAPGKHAPKLPGDPHVSAAAAKSRDIAHIMNATAPLADGTSRSLRAG